MVLPQDPHWPEAEHDRDALASEHALGAASQGAWDRLLSFSEYRAREEGCGDDLANEIGTVVAAKLFLRRAKLGSRSEPRIENLPAYVAQCTRNEIRGRMPSGRECLETELGQGLEGRGRTAEEPTTLLLDLRTEILRWLSASSLNQKIFEVLLEETVPLPLEELARRLEAPSSELRVQLRGLLNALFELSGAEPKPWERGRDDQRRLRQLYLFLSGLSKPFE